MLTDAAEVSRGSTLTADVCIVGAGPAGISIARELIKGGCSVLLLESGDRQFRRGLPALAGLALGRQLAKGENAGHPYFPLHASRLRAFGGTSNIWMSQGMRAHPLDAIDFEARPGVPHSGWPFDREQLDPYYERAQPVCGLGPYRYDVERWEDPRSKPRFAADAPALETTVFQFGPVDGFTRHLDELADAGRVNVVFDASAAEALTVDQPSVVSGLRVVTQGGNEFMAQGRVYVLALGGIDNPRLLLESNAAHREGLGNEHDLVGRFFMEHPHVLVGYARPADAAVAARLDLYQYQQVDGVLVQGMLKLRSEVLRQEQLPNSVFFLTPNHDLNATSGARSAAELRMAVLRRPMRPQLARHVIRAALGGLDVGRLALRRLTKRYGPPELIRFAVMSEQVPNRDSRVTLSAKRDALGMRLPRLDWRVTDDDRHTIRRAQEIIDDSLRRAGIGAFEGFFGDEQPPVTINGGFHHMGTTRMHTDPSRGVVDADCRVHGVQNLYIAGSAVFPTAGYANPTLTIVALALRLADHLAAELG